MTVKSSMDVFVRLDAFEFNGRCLPGIETTVDGKSSREAVGLNRIELDEIIHFEEEECGK
jgi:hypothetical protein